MKSINALIYSFVLFPTSLCLANDGFAEAVAKMRLIGVRVVSHTDDSGQVSKINEALTDQSCKDLSAAQHDVYDTNLIERDETMTLEDRSFYEKNTKQVFKTRRIQYCFAKVENLN